MKHKNSAGVGVCTLLSAGFFSLALTHVAFNVLTLLVGSQKEHPSGL